MQKMRMMYDVNSPDAQWPGFAERKSFKTKFQALYWMKQIRRYGHAAILTLVGIGSILYTASILLNPMRAMGEPPTSWYASMALNRGNPPIIGR